MIIAVDFDGTLCGESNFPSIGEPKLQIINWLIVQKKLGHKLILWTCREGEYLDEAINWCANLGLTFDSHNCGIRETSQSYFGKHKVIADIYLDDKAMKLSDVGMNVEMFERGK